MLYCYPVVFGTSGDILLNMVDFQALWLQIWGDAVPDFRLGVRPYFWRVARISGPDYNKAKGIGPRVILTLMKVDLIMSQTFNVALSIYGLTPTPWFAPRRGRGRSLLVCLTLFSGRFQTPPSFCMKTGQLWCPRPYNRGLILWVGGITCSGYFWGNLGEQQGIQNIPFEKL